MKKIFTFLFYLILFFYSSCKLEEESYDLVLLANEIDIAYTGQKGIISFNTNSTSTFDLFDIKEIEDTKYDMTISLNNTENHFSVSCNIWKPKEDNIRIFCRLKDIFSEGIQNITLNEYILKYKEKTIKIYSENFFEIYIINAKVPFLYSDKQIINFNEDKKEYDLKFNISDYNGENLLFYNEDISDYINLGDNCTINGKELICIISKDKLEGHLINEEQPFKIMSINKTFNFQIDFILIFDVIIKYHVEKKENIEVNITKMINGILNSEEYAAFETDIMKIPEVITSYFSLNFRLINGNEKSFDECLFKKYDDDKPLFLLCSMRSSSEEEEKYTLSETKENIKLENINVKYNFIIKPIHNSEIISIKNKEGGLIYSVYPYALDYTKKDAFTIFYVGGVNYITGLTLFPDSKDLDCKYSPLYIECTIPKSYFKTKKNGHYYVYHTNYLGSKSANYELAPINVNIPEENSSNYLYKKENILKNILLLLLALLIN